MSLDQFFRKNVPCKKYMFVFFFLSFFNTFMGLSLTRPNKPLKASYELHGSVLTETRSFVVPVHGFISPLDLIATM